MRSNGALVRIRSFQLLPFIAISALTACSPSKSNDAPPVLVFRGSGSSPNSAKAIEAILKANHLGYATVSSKQLNAMSESQLMAYRLLIIPGGNYISMGNSLTPDSAANVH